MSIEDSFGNLVTSDNSTTVTVALGANPGGSTLSGTLTQTATGGVATFNNLSLNNTATGYTGAQAITFSGPANSPNNTAPTYPATVNFTAGVGTASITLTNAASTTR